MINSVLRFEKCKRYLIILEKLQMKSDDGLDINQEGEEDNSQVTPAVRSSKNYNFLLKRYEQFY